MVITVAESVIGKGSIGMIGEWSPETQSPTGNLWAIYAIKLMCKY